MFNVSFLALQHFQVMFGCVPKQPLLELEYMAFHSSRFYLLHMTLTLPVNECICTPVRAIPFGIERVNIKIDSLVYEIINPFSSNDTINQQHIQ